MYEYIEAFNAYIAEHKQEYKCPNVGAVLEMLCCCYQRQRGVDTEIVRAYYDELYDSAGKFLKKGGSKVVDDATKLCSVIQDQAFQEGVIVGFRLYNEIYKRLGKCTQV